MPRGAKKAVSTTAALYRNGVFFDERKRSFISIDDRFYLRGVDMTVQRQRVFYRDDGICQICKHDDVEAGEVHHIKHRGKGGSDDLDNLKWICQACHRKEHVQVQWGN
jgi:hypothetical protein